MKVSVDSRELSLSNLDKPLYPDGTTKAEVIDYYHRIAPVILPHLADRALTRIRFPDGADRPGFFEKNDTFVLIFAIPSAYFFYSGSLNGDFRLWIGLGILLYGICYVFVHDIFIHQRFRWLRRTNNVYLTAIRKAHLVHHKHLGPEDGECFGMLLAHPKYFREARAAVAARRGAASGSAGASSA